MKHINWKNLYIWKKIHIFSKRANTSNIIYWRNLKYFKEHVVKRIFQKILMKKSKCSKRAHLWLNSFSSLGHLIMIAPIRFGLLFVLISLESNLFFFSFGKGCFVIHPRNCWCAFKLGSWLLTQLKRKIRIFIVMHWKVIGYWQRLCRTSS
jgi:hypothetical protein